MDVSQIDSIKIRLPFDSVVVNSSTDIWVFYNTPIVCAVLGNSSQHITISVQHPWLTRPLCFSFVHAKCTLEERRTMWQDLLVDKPDSMAWCVCGDFNVIGDPIEKRGGRPFTTSEGLELLSFMEEAEVFDAGFSGASFTWCNNRQGRARIWKRLDRVLVNGGFAEGAPTLAVVHLARHPSDHAPLKISLSSRMGGDSWSTFAGSLLQAPVTRRAIQDWNKGVLGNVFENVRRAEEKVLAAENRTEVDASTEAQVELNQAQAELRNALLNEEKFWGQKARVKWLRFGDRNSRFFHATVQQRRAQGAIHRVKNENGAWVEDDEGIAAVAVRYFTDMFSVAVEGTSREWAHLIPNVVTQADRMALEACPTIEEVKRVVFEMDGDSAAGPDGFTGQFFTFAWDIIAQDVYTAVLSFFCGAELPRFVTSTSIVLIPKVPNPQDFSKFRPISLCNFFNKVLSRILADRLAAILPKVISPQQTGFVKGRNITENYLLAQELLSGIRHKSRGSLSMGHRMDFSNRVGASARAIRYRQRYLSLELRGCPPVTHLAFADDVLIFANGSARSLKDIVQVLEMYQRASGQLVNAQKSGYLVHPSVCLSRRRVIERITGFPRQQFPVRYLGFPLYVGRYKSAYFGEVCHSISARILSWRSKLLSPGGRLVLIKHVLSAIPTHLLSAAVIPMAVFKAIERVCASFLWGSSGELNKHHWIKWSQLCYPEEEGGAGFRRVRDVYKAFSCKLWWILRTGSSLWVSFMRAKYCKGVHPCQVGWAQSASATWRRMLDVSRQMELSMLWLLNGGGCDFWYDNWVGSGGLFLRAPVVPASSFADVMTNGAWDSGRLLQILPSGIVDLVMKTPVPSGRGTDQVVWMPTKSGAFTLASAYQEERQGRTSSLVLSRIWQARIPLKVSFFMLRLLMRRLPLDNVLGEMGFKLASKCFCCVDATGETLEHVFSTGQLALEVWNYFQSICRIASDSSSIRSHLFAWWMSLAPSGEQRFICSVTPIFICWNIWKARCRVVFDGARVRAKEICGAVFQDVKAAFEIHFKVAVQGSNFQVFYTGVSQAPYLYECKIVRWEAGGYGCTTLNTDGCAKGNPGVSGGGGVLRDSGGHVLVAFSAYLGEGSSLRAETLAALLGIQLCLGKGVGPRVIQSDSLLLTEILKRRYHCPWHIRREVEQIWHLVGEARFVHCYREANKVADILSNVGVSHSQQLVRVYDSELDLPVLARGEVRLNRLGLPSIRRVRLRQV
ncbi:uncharacterized protein LOC113766418 [Coffea eugenioides]|uniref:uncharacterized protein LOC113766418 n=1 Tax=Coffea eugenioides TaxID=49369 RepID=UPI000F604F42|nr:uncharacterized protein LOC113766418 [Coffea eugenioides]